MTCRAVIDPPPPPPGGAGDDDEGGIDIDALARQLGQAAESMRSMVSGMEHMMLTNQGRGHTIASCLQMELSLPHLAGCRAAQQ